MTTTPEVAALSQEETIASLGHYGYGWSDSDVAGASARRGISEAVVRDISDSDLLRLGLIENIQRENLNPIEMAKEES